jgi:IS1 family transposase
VSLARGAAAAGDELGRFVGTSHEPRGRWPALAHGTAKVLADGCGRRRDEVGLQLKAVLAPWGSPRVVTAPWGAYARQLAPEPPGLGNRPTPQRERKPVRLRPRIKRRAQNERLFRVCRAARQSPWVGCPSRRVWSLGVNL